MMNADRAAAIVKDEGEIMAKTPVATVERFRIHAETSMEQMGHVLAELTRMGLQNVGYELITDIVTFKNNGPRQTFDSTGPDFIVSNQGRVECTERSIRCRSWTALATARSHGTQTRRSRSASRGIASTS